MSGFRPARVFVGCLTLLQSAAGAVPTIGGVVTASTFGGSPLVAPGSFIEIYGADLSSTTRQWNAGDFTGLQAPTSLDGVTVTVAGQAAFVYYVSPGQVDALLPSGIAAGRQSLTVGRAGTASAPYSIDVGATQPALWSPTSLHAGGKPYVAAMFPDFKTFVLPAGTIPGVVSRQAHPGETIVLLGAGFGSVTPDIPAGRIVGEATQVVSPVVFSFGKTVVTPVYAGLMPGAVGLYQFNLVVPDVPDNDAVPLSFTCGGVPGAQTLFTAVSASGRTGIGTSESIDVNGVTRTYTLYVPANFQPGVSGLVILMHGYTGHAAGMDNWTHMNDKADEAGFALVCPQGMADVVGITQWNYFYYPYWAGAEPDDTGFLRQLIDTLQATVRPDPKRIYLTGFSAGALMSHRAAVELSSRVAAIAPVAGTIFGTPLTDHREAPRAGGPVSVLILHGDADATVPYCGGAPGVRFATQDQSFDYWAFNNGCTSSARLCDGGPTAVATKRASNCQSNTDVIIYKLIGGVHNWYSQPMNDPKVVPYNPDINATTGVTTTDLIWNFFAAHPKP